MGSGTWICLWVCIISSLPSRIRSQDPSATPGRNMVGLQIVNFQKSTTPWHSFPVFLLSQEGSVSQGGHFGEKGMMVSSPSWCLSILTLLFHITVAFSSFYNLTKPHHKTGREVLELLLRNERLFQKPSALLFNHIVLILISKSFMMIMLFLAVLSLIPLSLGVLSSFSSSLMFFVSLGSVWPLLKKPFIIYIETNH